MVATLYADRSLTLKEIARRCGVNARKISRQARLEGWPPRQRKSNERRRETKLRVLIGRMFNALDRQMREIEERLVTEQSEQRKPSAAERERDARTLVALTRTLEKLRDLQREANLAAKAESAASGSAGDGREEADTEGMRAQLERRLARLVAANQEAGVSGKPE